jgi:Zn-dependent peptidase ImmA (M78 family)/DNA-binding Xre family transcriptional regulator
VRAEDSILEAFQNFAQADSVELSALIQSRREELGISKRQMTRVLNISQSSLDRILNGEAQTIDVVKLLKLSSFLQMDLEKLVQSYVASAPQEKVRELEEVRAKSFIVSNFDLEGLRKVGFVDSITDLEAIRDRITTFFGLESVFQYQREVARPLFSSSRSPGRDKMKEFWVRSAYHQFEKRPNPNEYDREKLLDLVPQIRQYTRFEENGLTTVAKALYEVGVTVIGQSYLPFTQVRGGTFVVDGKPCIVVTDYRKDYGTVWFSLLHEVGHVLYHLDQIKSFTYHLSDDTDKMLVEDEANYFARELLLPEEKLNYIEPLIDNPEIVKRYARKNDIHPSLIYSFHAYRKYMEEGDDSGYRKYSQYRVSPEKALEPIRCNPWENETAVDDIDKALNNLAAD